MLMFPILPSILVRQNLNDVQLTLDEVCCVLSTLPMGKADGRDNNNNQIFCETANELAELLYNFLMVVKFRNIRKKRYMCYN